MCATLNALKKLAAFLPRKQIIFLAAGEGVSRDGCARNRVLRDRQGKAPGNRCFDHFPAFRDGKFFTLFDLFDFTGKSVVLDTFFEPV